MLRARRVAEGRAANLGKSNLPFPIEGKVDTTVLDEVVEVVTLPDNGSIAHSTAQANRQVVLPDSIMAELRSYVDCVATMYRNNAFHNFEHASHVAMSVSKLLSRIVAPDLDDNDDLEDGVQNISMRQIKTEQLALSLHDHTYGITSDPLTQFSCIFSALIHDVDHSGVPNTQLLKENSSMAKIYKNRSVAEQNSFNLSWSLLFDERFDHLRSAIYSTKDEQQRFRQLVVNSVMATDISDKELKTLRNNRWSEAFNESQQPTLRSPLAIQYDINRKATIVIEHLIQASDVYHTMQHWHIYRRWNERLFIEMTLAFRKGRAETDPKDFWYTSEIGFFDFFIIPLAKKLKECGVFGKSSDEYLNYAKRNRSEWEIKGESVIAEMVENLKNADETSKI